MRAGKTVAAVVFVTGVAAGIAAGIIYYNNHLGDWRIGAAAVGIAVGVAAGAGVVAWLVWLLFRAEARRPPAAPVAHASLASSGSAAEISTLLQARPTSTGGSGYQSTTNLVDIGAALASIGAGIYLLTSHSVANFPAGTQSWFQLIAHAMGIYFIAKGLFIARSTSLQAEARNNLARLVELAETASARVEPTSTPETEGQ